MTSILTNYTAEPLLKPRPRLVLLSGVPVHVDDVAEKIGVFDEIRGDVRKLSNVKPVEKISVERVEQGYRGILYSRGLPYLFVMNARGFAAKPVDDADGKVSRYCSELSDNERRLTMMWEAECADKEQDDLNAELGSHRGNVTPFASVYQGPNTGPDFDVVERVPAAYRQRLRVQRKCEDAAGGVVVNEDGKVLLVKPTNGYGGYDWTFPKGYLTRDEQRFGLQQEGAMREVREETGHACAIERPIGPIKHNDGGVCVYYVMKPRADVPVKQRDGEVEELRWVSYMEALELLNDDKDVDILGLAFQEVPRLIIKAEKHTGFMIACYVPSNIAKRIALADGLEPDDLHVTLVYLGKGLSEEDQRKATDVVRTLSAVTPPLVGKLGGVGRFSSSETTEGRDVIYLSVDSPALTRFRPVLVDALNTAGLSVNETHGYSPHVTLAYIAKDAESPLKRLEPVDVTFVKLCAANGDKKFSFPMRARVTLKKGDKISGGKADKKRVSDFDSKQLKIGTKHELEHTDDEKVAREIAMDHLTEDPEYYTKLSKIEKARNVKEPGKRGAHPWIDDKGNARYDEKPAPETKKIEKVRSFGVKAVAVGEKQTRVKKTPLGVVFMRRASDHKADDYKTAAHNASKYGIADITEGEVDLVFKELLNSKHTNFDKFVRDVVEPLWDDDGGKNPYSLDGARKYVEKILLYLEMDKAIEHGARDALYRRKPISWERFARSAEMMERSKSSQKFIREMAREILSHYECTSKIGNEEWKNTIRYDARLAGSGAAAYHSFTGRVALRQGMATDIKAFCEAVAKEDVIRHGWYAVASFCALLHEELHGASGMSMSSYEGVGVVVEELSTEVSARFMMRDKFGHMRLNPLATRTLRDEPKLNVSGEGPYGEYIIAVHRHLIDVMDTGSTSKPMAADLPERAARLLEKACLKMKHADAKKTLTPTEHLDSFIDCFGKDLTAGQKKAFAEKLRTIVVMKVM